MASVSITVESQARHLSACHGMRVSPSGLLPSDLNRPLGSLANGTMARPRARQIMSFNWWYRIDLPALCSHDKPCMPRASNGAPHRHGWGSHKLTPRRNTYCLIVQSRTACCNWQGMQPVSAMKSWDDEEPCFAMVVGKDRPNHWLVGCNHWCIPYILLRCQCVVRWGRPWMEDRCAVADSTTGSDEGEDRPRSSDWRERVLAANAKKAEGASKATWRIPRPPALTATLAWVHWMSDRSELVTRQKSLRRRLSNWTRLSLPAQGERRKICNILGALQQALSRTRASCASSKRSLSIALSRSSHRFAMVMSIAVSRRRGAPRSHDSSIFTRVKCLSE